MMTGKLLTHIVLFLSFLSSLVYLATGNDDFVLDLAVVEFDELISTPKLNLEVLEVKGAQIGWTEEIEDGDYCTGENIPRGPVGSFELDTYTKENWKIRVRTRPEYHLSFDSPLQKIRIAISFGDDAPDADKSSNVTLEGGPFEINEQGSSAKWSDGDDDEILVFVNLKLEAENNDCTIFDDGIHGFTFTVSNPLYPGKYMFDPCSSYIRFDDFSRSVTYKNNLRRRLEWIEENPGRFLEEDTCTYCLDGGTSCPCCPDPDDGNSTDFAPQEEDDDDEVTDTPVADEEPPERRALIIGYTVGGVAIAVVLVLCALLIRYVMQEDSSSKAVLPNTEDDVAAAANN